MVTSFDISTARRMRGRARRAVALVAAFGLWTLVVWVGRINNILDAQGLSPAGRAGRLALAASFVVAAVVVLVRLWLDRARIRISVDAAGRHAVEATSGLRRAVLALGLYTAAVWLVRGGSILVGPYDTAFKVVHTVLAVGSIALAVAAGRAIGVRSPATPGRR
jgi:hypothetical protein